jgi:hypothetical protein
MTRLRFSLGWLLGVVAAVAFACAAIRAESDLWASLAFTLCLGVLLVSIVGVLFSAAEPRAFWTGFAVFGWGYLLLVFGPWFDHFGRSIITTKLLKQLHVKLQRTIPAPAASVASSPGGSAGMGMGQAPWGSPGAGQGSPQGMDPMAAGGWQPGGGAGMGGTRIVGPSSEQVWRVGHSLFALLFAVVGGGLASWFYGRRQQLERAASGSV